MAFVVRVFAVFLLALASSGTGLAMNSACAQSQGRKHANLPVVAPINAMTYACSYAGYSDAPPTLGSLSPQGSEQGVQLCDANCDYAPVDPDDPESPLYPVRCGALAGRGRPYAVNGTAIAQSNSAAAAAPYPGTGGNCMPLMIPQAPIDINQSKPPTVKIAKPSPLPSASASPSPEPHA